MAWKSYDLDQIAQKLVLDAKKRDLGEKRENSNDKSSLNQAHKMRMAVAYGLERFWGEHLRLKKEDENKSKFWKETWDALSDEMKKAEICLPKDPINSKDVNKIQELSDQLWALPIDEQRIAIAVLTQLCDCIVWWTQRYK